MSVSVSVFLTFCEGRERDREIYAERERDSQTEREIEKEGNWE